MTHLSQTLLNNYVNDQVTAIERQHIEDHLFTCDECLHLYMTVMDQISESSEFIRSSEFTNQVIQTLPIKPQTNKAKPNKKFYKQPLFHYGIAAAITIILMTSGLFQELTSMVPKMTSTTSQHQSVSKTLVDKTVSLINSVETMKKGER